MSAKYIKVTNAPENADNESPTESALSTIDTKTNLEAALIVHEAGFQPIPIIPGKKIPTCKHHPWLDELSPKTISNYWSKHPDHEIGCITGDLLVLDADSDESIAQLHQLEDAFDVTPLLTVNTKKGVHHYHMLASGVFAKSDAHSSKTHPARIDIRTGSGLVIMPPSTGKEINVCEISHVNELTKIGQDFIDAVFRHNGREVPRKQIAVAKSRKNATNLNQTHKELDALINHLDPNCGYEDWITPSMAVHYETDGSDDGLSIFDDWSSQGDDYPGFAEIEYKWKSFNNHTGAPVTKATLCKMVAENGHDWVSILDRLGPQFQKCNFEVVGSNDEKVSTPTPKKAISFDAYSLTGMSPQLVAEALAEVFVLAGLALLGQWTVFYAIHGAGKTLLVIYLLAEAIHQGLIKASDVYYFNLDDNQAGLIAKLKIAEEVGFHVISEGYRNFKVKDFIALIQALCDGNQARGIVLILDTLKKFTDLMDKRSTSQWNRIIRLFIATGGTVVGLAHVNKNRGSDGKPIYAGTTDIIDDADCAYVLDVINVDHDTNTKTVEFENKKNRGNVVNSVAYSYSIEDGIDYDQLLASVEKVDQSQLVQVKKAEANQSDAEIIDAITGCIREGINARMRLRDEVNERAGVSKRKVLNILDKYTGQFPDQHKWFYTTQKHGRKVYQLLT